MSALRCFVAFDLPGRTVVGLTAAQDLIRRSNSSWAEQKWVRPENLHLTVAFLGQVEPSTVPEIEAAISDALTALSPVHFRIESLAPAPRAARATMLWAQVDDDGSVAAVAVAVGESLRAFGIAPDGRRFTPHITLVRSRRSLRASIDLAGVYSSSGLDESVVSDPPLTLYESHLTPQGPRYTPRISWTVGRGADEIGRGSFTAPG